ncbi:MAG: sulfatase-like hydrolase/transferase [Clostridia bacterium]
MKSKPNIIFMLTDDQRYDTMGFMGSKQVYTPCLDSLAKDGVKFSNAFHIAPICMPSRASIQLGKYIGQHHCGFDVPTDYTVTNAEYQESYPVLLRKNGYYSGFIGKFGFSVTEEKIHNAEHKIHPDSPAEDPYYLKSNPIDAREDALPKDQFDVWHGFIQQGKYRPDADKKLFNGEENIYNAEHLTDLNTYQACDFLEKAKEKDQSFVLSISYKAPHRPFDPQKKWADYYADMTIERMANDCPEYFEKLPEVVRTHSRNASEYWGMENYRPSWGCQVPWKEDVHFQNDFRNYYALISGVDESVGKIREKLKELELDNNTIIIYTSDNGFFCGSKQIGGKELLYEESIHAPMIVFDPRMDTEKQDRWIDGLISHVDICPTILEYAGIEKTDSMYGTSFVPLITGEKDEIVDAVYGENDFNDNYASKADHPHPEKYQSIHSKYVRTKEYKYIRYHLCEPIIEEMWAIDKDPLETNNLVNDPTYKEQLDKMRKMLDDFIELHNCPMS